MTPERGWTAFVEHTPAQIMTEMPPDLSTRITQFLVAFALEAGSAIDAGKEPPGGLLDDATHRYGLQVQGEPVIFEYTVHRDIREIRIPILVWFH